MDKEELRRLAQAIPDKKEPGESAAEFIRRRREAFLDFKDAANPAAVLELLDEIELIQSEVNEQARLLGMSAERELALLAEIERLRADIEVREDGAEKMALKGIEMRAEIQRLISERVALGLAIDRALAGIVPDEHPLRSRLVEIAAMRAEIETMKRQKPAAWMCPDDPDSATAFSWRPVACELASCLKRRVPLYLAPGAQTAPSVPDDDDAHDPSTAAIEYALRTEEGLEFLRCWLHGDFDAIRREWSDAPEDVFTGADPLYRAPGAQENNDES